MVKLFLPSTVKFNRLTLKMWLVSVNMCIMYSAVKCNSVVHRQSGAVHIHTSIIIQLCIERVIQCLRREFIVWIISGEHTSLFVLLSSLFFYMSMVLQICKNSVCKHVIFFKLDYDVKDGERLPLAIKDMGPCEMFPQTLSHNPNGRYGWFLILVFSM